MTNNRVSGVWICAVTLALISACSSNSVGKQHDAVTADAGSVPSGGAAMTGAAGAAQSTPMATATAGSGVQVASAGTADAGSSVVGGASGAATPAAGAGAGAPPSAGSVAAGSAGSATGGASGTSTTSAGAGAVAMSGSGGGGSGGNAGSDATPEVKPPCLKKPSEVALLGDGYIKYPYHNFPQDLAKAVGSTYRNLVQGGDGFLGPATAPNKTIAQSYAAGVAQDKDIVAVVMTGGGDDIFFSMPTSTPGDNQCKNSPDSPTIKVCQDIVAAAVMGASSLFTTMANDGVKDVVYMGYPHIPSGGLAGTNPAPIYDYLSKMMQSLCSSTEKSTNGKLRCHFLDLVPVFDGHPDWFDTSLERYYPNTKGSAAMADAVAKVLKDNCIAQSVGSACCAP